MLSVEEVQASYGYSWEDFELFNDEDYNYEENITWEEV